MKDKLKCQIIELQSFIYLVSDREIKEGDWLMSFVNIPYKALRVDDTWIWSQFGPSKELDTLRFSRDDLGNKKIEATTDPSLGLPLIPDSFVKEWVEKQGKIEWVYLAMGNRLHTNDKGYISLQSTGEPAHDINSVGNEAIILLAKDSFTREDVKRIVYEFSEGYNPDVDTEDFNHWFDKNY